MPASIVESFRAERQITSGPGGRILTHAAVWSPDGRWLVYDTRSDPAGNVFDGKTIEAVHTESRETRILYTAKNGACCGVATFHPRESRIAFILGPENPTADWQYGPSHRQGAVVDLTRPGVATLLDARNLVPPFTPGALRGGSHVHLWDAAGQWVSFTYQDALYETGIRDVGVAVPDHPVHVPRSHPRNHDGMFFSVIVTRTVAKRRAGSDEIQRACEEAWIGTNGYTRADGTRQRHALAFQGQVLREDGVDVSEVFVADLPDDLTHASNEPLAGSATQRPAPPRGVVQRRLTFTTRRKYPGLQGPRHWLRSSPDGERIACLMRDDDGIAQLWTIAPRGGDPVQVTRHPWPVSSAFTWSPDGRRIAHVMDRSICLTEVVTGTTTRLTPPVDEATSPRPEACVFSPDGARVAYVRRLRVGENESNQVFTVSAL